MAYADYAYYKDGYLGAKIPEADFPRMIRRAGVKLDQITFGRAEAYAQEHPEDTRLKDAACAVADVLYSAEQASKAATDESGRGLKSESNDGYSVTFADTLDILSATTLRNIDMSCRSAAAEYLSMTGLMYAGVSVRC